MSIKSSSKGRNDKSPISLAEKRKLTTFASAASEYPRERSVHDLFEEIAAGYPEMDAVFYKGRFLSYFSLNERANQVAHKLMEKGLKSEEPVGLLMEKSVELIVGLLAILKAGGAYLPIDPEYPEERIRYIIEDSRCRYILIAGRKELVRHKNTEYIDLLSDTVYSDNKSNPELEVRAGNLAYIIYTSGTTGVPKGSLIEHRSIVRLVRNTNYIEINNDDKIFSTSSIAFDAFTFEVWGALLNGAQLHMAEKDVILKAASLKKDLEEKGISILWLTSALFTLIAEADTSVFSGLRVLLAGGDVLSAQHVNKVRQANPGLIFINGYGPTENTTFSACYKIEKDFKKNIPIGKPVSNSRCYVFDENMNYQPIGVIGDLYLAGDGLSRGYLNRDDLNREKFVEHPDIPGERLYRSGDLARWLEDGTLEFHGRRDNQLKIRGYRVEIEEIEIVIKEIEGVLEAAVKPVHINERDIRLVAFVSHKNNVELEPGILREKLKLLLPEYMLPDIIRIVTSFPLTHNGKIDKNALEINTLEFSKILSDRTGGLNPLQKELFEIFLGLIQIETFNIGDDFFSIGGNSLLAFSLINKLNERFGIQITYKELRENSSVSLLSDLIKSGTSDKSGFFDLHHNSSLKNLPLTRNQKRIWITSRMNPESPAYNIPLTYRFRGDLNTEIFKKSIEIVFNKHFSVFSVFREVKGEPVAEINYTSLDFVTRDLTKSDKDAALKQLNELINDYTVKPFDLTKGPLFRLCIFNTGEQEFYFHMTIHHIVFDGVSVSILIEEINSIYERLLQEKDPGITPLAYQQYDFAEWEEFYFSSKKWKADQDYFIQKFQGAGTVLDFPHDYSRPKTNSGIGGCIPFSIEGKLYNALKQLVENTGKENFSILFSVFSVLLQRYSSQKDFNIGLPVSNRPASYFEDCFGMFVNTIPVRVQMEESSTFVQMLDKVNTLLIEAIDHKEFPFEEIVEIVNPERVLNINPLVQVVFAWQNSIYRELNPGRVITERIVPERIGVPLDLAFNLWEENDKIRGEVEFNIDLFKGDTIERLILNFLSLLEAVIDLPDMAINKLPVVSGIEKERILSFNNTSTEYPREASLPQLFEEVVRNQPGKEALNFNGESLSYIILNERANQLAHILLEKGLNKEEPVGLLMEKSMELIVGLLGILKAGGAYLPIDPEYPEERIRYIIEDSQCRFILIAGSKEYVRYENTEYIDLLSDTSYSENRSNPEQGVRAGDLAYIIYTSGTTGVPKGSLIEHRGVVRLVKNTNYLKFNSESKVLFASAMVFDPSTLEIWGALLNGGTLYIALTDTLYDVDKIGRLLHRFEINIVALPSALFTRLVDADPSIFSTTRYLFIGGDVLSASHVNRVRKENPGITVINAYGPTENTTNSTCYIIENEFTGNIPIGKPVSNSRCYVFDENMNYQPIGVIGELYLAGDGLSRGYLNREELNREKFTEHPDIPGERLYRSGDLARWLEDGTLEFHGRRDNQLKIRGYRIELDGIEAVLNKKERVAEAIVNPVAFREGDVRLVAFVLPVEGLELNPVDLLMELRGELPLYMVPSYIRIIEEIPRTINGKIDRKALQFNITDAEEEREDEGTYTLTQEKILDIWRKELNSSSIGIRDNFFNIGGNSLIAIKILNKLEDTFNCKLSFKDIFGNTTVEDLSGLIEKRVDTIQDGIGLKNIKLEGLLTVSRNQRRIWMDSVLNKRKASYVMTFSFKIEGDFNLEVFTRSLNYLYNRHEVLHSVFTEKDGEVRAEIKHKGIDIRYIYLGNEGNERKEEQLRNIMNDDSVCPFNLTEGPLSRYIVFRKDMHNHVFYAAIHHIIFDGWSWGVFLSELSETYNSFLQGVEPGLQKLPFNQYDYANWESETDYPQGKEDLRAYWGTDLTGVNTHVNFPINNISKRRAEGFAEHVIFKLDERLSKGLISYSKENEISMYSLLLGVFGILLSKYSGEKDFCIGSPVALRPSHDLEGIFGMFVNTIPIRIDLQTEATIKGFLNRTNKRIVQAISHKDLPFEDIVELINPERHFNTNPLFQVIFSWEEENWTKAEFTGFSWEKILAEGGSTPFDFGLYCSLNNGIIEGTFTFDKELYKRDEVKKIEAGYQQLLTGLINSDEALISGLNVISPAEKHMLETFASAPSEYPRERSVHDLFEEIATRYPEKDAVYYKDSFLSYSDLNRRSNQLAHRLLEKGLKKEEPVGILMEKSLELIVGLLGILKAGGAYLPIDPEYPEERIRFIIEDSQCRYILIAGSKEHVRYENTEYIDMLSDTSYSENRSNPELGLKSGNLAYIIYTSGTTGVPKGSLIEHRGVVRLVRNTNYIEIGSNDKILSTSAIAFDAFTFEVWGALLSGAQLHLADKEVILKAALLQKELEKRGISIIWLTSALFTLLAENDATVFSGLRVLLAGGDVLSAQHINKVRRANPELTFINGYGPTENTTFSTCFCVDRDYDSNVPIGGPISNSRCYVFDEYMNYQPIGVIGELYLAGDGLSRGYLNREDLNREKFVEHPDIPGERLYRSGDLVRWLEDGTLEFHGRRDNQLKIRGYRVELDGIEALLNKKEMVAEAIVNPVTFKEGDIRLVAFVLPEEGRELNSADLLSELRGELPLYMVPSYIRIIDEVPRTINGKINRKALQFNTTEAEEEREDKGAYTKTQEKMLDIWRKELNISSIGIWDNFFYIGGNSILAIFLVDKIEKAFGLSLSLRVFFDAPTIHAIAEYIDLYYITKQKPKTSQDSGNSNILSGEI